MGETQNLACHGCLRCRERPVGAELLPIPPRTKPKARWLSPNTTCNTLCLGPSFHEALSSGLKLLDGTEGREEEEGECSERWLISALSGPTLARPAIAASREGGCVTQ